MTATNLIDAMISEWSLERGLVTDAVFSIIQEVQNRPNDAGNTRVVGSTAPVYDDRMDDWKISMLKMLVNANQLVRWQIDFRFTYDRKFETFQTLATNGLTKRDYPDDVG